MTFAAGFGRGPIDALREIEVGEKIAWSGAVCDDSPNYINSPDLFGGSEKEGGIQGGFLLLQGGEDQVLPGPTFASAPFVGGGVGWGETIKSASTGPVPSTTIPDIKQAMGGLSGEWRGFTAILFDGLVASMNPYLKEWRFRVWRSRKGWHNDQCWYPAKATIYLADGNVHAMNPAHIIYQCLTDPNWGKGEPTEMLDENSFTYAANLLCAEGLGLCIPWYRQEDVDSFIQVVADHIGAVIYQDRNTGRYTLRLLRDDYDPATIPHFDLDTGLLEIEEDDSGSSEGVNEVVITGFDPQTRQDFQVRAHGPVSRSIEFKGLATRELGARVAQRELRLLSVGLKKFRLKFDRRAWQLAPGSVCRISSAQNNISNMVVRIGEMSEGPSNGQRAITAKAMEDVFALPATTFTGTTENQWIKPFGDPEPAAAEILTELSYRDLYTAVGPGDLGSFDESDAAVGAMAIPTGGNSYLYDLATGIVGQSDAILTKNRSYSGSATLVSAIGPLDTAFTVEQPFDFDSDNIGQMLLLDDEHVELVAYDPETFTGTIARGCGDTIPAPHAPGARLWALDDDLSGDGQNYVAGESVRASVLPRSGGLVIDGTLVAELTIDLVGRHARPYPPADLKIDGVSVFEHVGEHPEPVFTWAHRDRVMQEDQLVSHTDPSIGPEPGTTYTFRIYTLAGVLLRTESGIAAATWTYTSAMQVADSVPSVVRVEVESARGTLASYQRYSFNVILNSGYGFGYGFNYGGA
jgi:hypothetical protein